MNPLNSRKRTACDRCRKLKVACRKLDLGDDVCERCLRAGLLCLTENEILPPAHNASSSSSSSHNHHRALSVSDWCYFPTTQPSAADQNATTVSDMVSTGSSTYTTSIPDSNPLGFAPSEFPPGCTFLDDPLTTAHRRSSRDLQPSGSLDVELDTHADRVLWDISRQLASLRETPWDPQGIRLGWLDVNFSIDRPVTSPPEVLLTITFRYIMLLQVLPPTNRITLRLLLLTTYIELTRSIDGMLTDMIRHVRDPSGLCSENSSSDETLHPKHHVFALVRSFECQLISMESLLGLPAEYRASSGEFPYSSLPFGNSGSRELLSVVMKQPQAFEGQDSKELIQSLRVTIAQMNTLLKSSFP